jgi:hypothetical protein
MLGFYFATRRRLAIAQIVAALKRVELAITTVSATQQLGTSERASYRLNRVADGLQSDPGTGGAAGR